MCAPADFACIAWAAWVQLHLGQPGCLLTKGTPAQVREEADAVASRCGADLRVTALAADTPAAQRDALLHAGQLVVATPGQVARVPHLTQTLL